MGALPGAGASAALATLGIICGASSSSAALVGAAERASKMRDFLKTETFFLGLQLGLQLGLGLRLGLRLGTASVLVAQPCKVSS